jgi:hypothetical protein
VMSGTMEFAPQLNGCHNLMQKCRDVLAQPEGRR